MPRLLMRFMGVGILIFGLLIGGVSLIGRILPTKHLAYISVHNNHGSLVLLDFYHRISVNLIPDAYTPAWSPDGKHIAFSIIRGGAIDLYIMDMNNQHVQPLPQNNYRNESPSWSPDGREIAFTSRYEDILGIFIMLVDCTDSFEHCATRLTPKDNENDWYSDPAWSPDGNSILFVRSTTTYTSAGESDIYIMNRDGSHLRRLTENLGDDDSPSWSPDSQHIVYTAENIQYKTKAIMIMDTKCNLGTMCVRPAIGDDFVRDPAWSPDGNSIVFADLVDNTYELYVTDPQGHYLQRLTYNDVSELNPQWRP